MKTLFIKFLAVAYLFVVSIPLTLLVYLLCYLLTIIFYFKNKKK